MDCRPKIFEENGEIRVTSELKERCFEDKTDRDRALAAYCSILFFWYFLAFSDCRNVSKREVYSFPLNMKKMKSNLKEELGSLTSSLMNNLQENSIMRSMYYKKYGKLGVQVFAPKLSKHIVDEIDVILAKYLNFSPEDLDFITNYDIKYRMGQ